MPRAHEARHGIAEDGHGRERAVEPLVQPWNVVGAAVDVLARHALLPVAPAHVTAVELGLGRSVARAHHASQHFGEGRAPRCR